MNIAQAFVRHSKGMYLYYRYGPFVSKAYVVTAAGRKQIEAAFRSLVGVMFTAIVVGSTTKVGVVLGPATALVGVSTFFLMERRAIKNADVVRKSRGTLREKLSLWAWSLDRRLLTGCLVLPLFVVPIFVLTLPDAAENAEAYVVHWGAVAFLTLGWLVGILAIVIRALSGETKGQG